MNFSQLQPGERLALAALVRAMVRLDRSYSAAESGRLNAIADELGPVDEDECEPEDGDAETADEDNEAVDEAEAEIVDEGSDETSATEDDAK